MAKRRLRIGFIGSGHIARVHFVAAVRDGAPLDIPIHDGLRALEVSTAMLKSAANGGTVVPLGARKH